MLVLRTTMTCGYTGANVAEQDDYRRKGRGKREKEPEKPTFRRRRLGERLRRLRGDRRAVDVVPGLGAGWSDSKISRIENGVSGLSVPDARKLLRAYATPEPEFAELVTLTRHAQQVGWWHDYKSVLPRDFGSYGELESDAVAIANYEETLVPGILQTPAYALEILQAGRLQDGDEEIERRLDVRMTRREILDRDTPPKTTFVLSETALRLPVGGPHVMVEQLRALLADADRPAVTVQVVPVGTGPHSATGFPHTIFTLPGDVIDVVYTEQLYGSRYDEDPETVARYRLAFNIVRAAALSPADSVALIERLEKELE